MGMELSSLAWLLLSIFLVTLTLSSEANQSQRLLKMIKSTKLQTSTPNHYWEDLQSTKEYSPVYIGPQEGLMQADKISFLPGEPEGVDFDQYSGYVTVDPVAGSALFYYFVESPTNSSTNPLVLWLNGGPGCSSFGYGAMEELGPFRVNSDGKTLVRNSYAWNNVANVIFLESPAGVGFSYSNTSSDYHPNNDESTARDAYTFLVNWLERFPQYKIRDFYITGESYAGHYVPQLAYTIQLNNNNTNNTTINLKGIAIGNALIDLPTYLQGEYEYLWSHALISDETYKGITAYCGDFGNQNSFEQCNNFTSKADGEYGDIDQYNIYGPLCHGNASQQVGQFDPCSDDYVYSYLNTPEVQKALHTKPTDWDHCGGSYNRSDVPNTILPIIKSLMASGLRVWIYSGDVDAVVPVTSTRHSINTFNLPVKNAWSPWYSNNEVGGYVEAYEGLTFATVRGAGHPVPSYQPERALTMISSFLQGTLPPSTG